MLALETSNPSAWTADSAVRPGVAVGRVVGAELQLLGGEEIDLERPHDDTLLAAAERAVRRAGGTPRDLVRVAVSAGPGGYTAVRLAITAAKMIAEATGAACVAVPTAWVVARRAVPGPAPFAVLLASKGETAFATVFGPSCEALDSGRLIAAADLGTLGVGRIIADRFLPKPIRDAAVQGSIVIQPPTFDAAACLEAGLVLPPVDPVALSPIYPREPEAVTKWRALHPHGPGDGIS